MPFLQDFQNLVLAPLLAEINFVVAWISALIVLLIVFELLRFLSKGRSVKINANEIPSYQLPSRSRPSLNMISIVFCMAFSVLLGGYIYLMFMKENFSYFDSFQFTHSNLIGKPFYMPIWRETGRFWPLGLQEYNALALIGRNFFTYQAFSVLQLLVVISLIYNIFTGFPLPYRIATIATVILLPSFTISFFGLIYPERNVIFWLSVLIFCRLKLVKVECVPPRVYLYGSLISAQFCLYYKEPIFVLIGSFASITLALSLLKERHSFVGVKSYFRFIAKHYADLGLLLLSILYISLFRIIVLPEITHRYSYNSKNTIIDAAFSYIDNNSLLVLFAVVVFVRFAYLVLSRKAIDEFWDVLALSALLYLATFLFLKMHTKYYSAPTEFIAVLYLSQLIYKVYSGLGRESLHRKALQRFVFLAITTMAFCLILSQSLQTTSNEILIRKIYVSGNMELARRIMKHRKVNNQDTVSLYFPGSTPYLTTLVTNFGAFLDYLDYKDAMNRRGTASSATLESSSSLASPGSTNYLSNFVLKSPLKFPHNRCVDFLYLNCFQAGPEKGDLIVLLPGLTSNQDFKVLKGDLKGTSQLIFSSHYENHLQPIERLLLYFSRQKDFSSMDVYIFQKNNSSPSK